MSQGTSKCEMCQVSLKSVNKHGKLLLEDCDTDMQQTNQPINYMVTPIYSFRVCWKIMMSRTTSNLKQFTISSDL